MSVVVFMPERQDVMTRIEDAGIRIDLEYTAMVPEYMQNDSYFRELDSDNSTLRCPEYAQAIIINTLHLIDMFLNSSAETLVILEDDVYFDTFARQKINFLYYQLPKEGWLTWDFFMLGRCFDSCESDEWVGPHDLVRCHYPKCTHAYAMTRRGASILHSTIISKQKLRHAVDLVIGWLIQSNDVVAYCAKPALVNQNWRAECDPISRH